MSASNPSRFLEDGGDDRALALKMFWGKVIEAFRNKSLLWDNKGLVVASKKIDSGKSWQFPIMGEDPDPEYHTPGNELLGQQIDIDEGTITVDDILVAHCDVPIDQIAISHFDTIRPFAMKLGRTLARDFDKKLFRTGVKAAQTAAVSGFHNGGNAVTREANSVALAYPTSSTGAQNFRNDVATLARQMDEDNVPEDGRYLFITPYIRQVLGQDTTIYSRDFSSNVPNDIVKRAVGMIEGFVIMTPTNHMPSTNVTTGPTQYQLDATVNGSGNGGTPVGLALCGAQEAEAAIGYVEAFGVQARLRDDDRRNTVFMKSQMMVGAGVLSPWCAGVVQVHTA